MFFSVSMPVYNSSLFIDKCIGSVIEQSFQEYELILVDDGSTDNSVEKCEEWVRKYPNRIRLVKKENSGSLFTRRRCLSESQGSYIYIMDSDDYLIDKDALQKIHDTLIETKCDLLFFNCTADEIKHEGIFAFPFENGDIFEGENLIQIYKYYIQASGLKPLWNKVFHRDLVDWNADYSSFTYVTNGTDYFQSTPIICNAKRICFLAETFYYYRKIENPTSIVHRFNPTIYASARANFLRLSEATKNWHIDEKEKKTLLTIECMKMVSTSVYKIRLMDKHEKNAAIVYLKQIGEDKVFLEHYHPSSMSSIYRRGIVVLLKHKKYALLYFAISVIDLIR